MSEVVYFIAQIQTRDLNDYIRQYALPTGKVLAQYGGEVLAATPRTQAIEGEWYGNWTVIVRFESADKAQKFMASPEYAPLRKIRVEQLTEGGNIALVPSFDPADFATG